METKVDFPELTEEPLIVVDLKTTKESESMDMKTIYLKYLEYTLS